jgi:DNA repair exonuclease SbcCD ATPase subunit
VVGRTSPTDAVLRRRRGATASKSAEEAPAEAVSDAEHVLRIDEVIPLDRAKLRELEKELEEREGFFEELAKAGTSVQAELEEKRKTLEELPADADPDERLALEGEIEKLETELELFETQSDLAFTSLTTIRTQIEALEKKLEREQRALDVLSGVAPKEPAARPAAPSDVAQPGAVPTGVPIVPGMPPTRTATETVPPTMRIETTAQLEALRDVERLEAEARQAEQAVVEFIKRKESLEEQIDLEGRVGKELRADSEYGEWVMEDPVMLGVDKFTEYGVIIKFMVQTRPDKKFPVRRELLRRVKKRLDEAGIEISVPHRLLVQRQAGRD